MIAPPVLSIMVSDAFFRCLENVKEGVKVCCITYCTMTKRFGTSEGKREHIVLIAANSFTLSLVIRV